MYHTSLIAVDCTNFNLRDLSVLPAIKLVQLPEEFTPGYGCRALEGRSSKLRRSSNVTKFTTKVKISGTSGPKLIDVNDPGTSYRKLDH